MTKPDIMPTANRRCRRSLLATGLALGMASTFGAGTLLAHDNPIEGAFFFPDSEAVPQSCVDHATCGEFSNLYPATPTATHGGFIYSGEPGSRRWDIPRWLIWVRHANQTGFDIFDEACMERLVLASGYSAWPIPDNEWLRSLGASDELGFPDNINRPGNIFKDGGIRQGGVGGLPNFYECMKVGWKALYYGGWRARHGLTQSVPQRIKAYMSKEITQVWDPMHPDAYANSGVYDPAGLTEEDANLSLAAWSDAGQSKGLNYLLYCPGHATTGDGLAVNIGLHDGNSNSGGRKVSVYDPVADTWGSARFEGIDYQRPMPCHLANFNLDPEGVRIGLKAANDAAATADPTLCGTDRMVPCEGKFLINPANDPATGEPIYWNRPALGSPPGLIRGPDGADCDQFDRDHTDPRDPSDDRYGRWYPTGIAMPPARGAKNTVQVMFISGTSQDTSQEPIHTLTNVTAGNAASPGRNFNLQRTKIYQAVMGLYDVNTDTTLALENARRRYPLYPLAFVVQTKRRNWQLCTIGGFDAPANEATVPRTGDTYPAAEWRILDPATGLPDPTGAVHFTDPGAAFDVDKRAIKFNGPFGPGSLDCLDVEAVRADRLVNIPAENHWTKQIAVSAIDHGYRGSQADVLVIGPDGETESHFAYVAGGILPGTNPQIQSDLLQRIDLKAVGAFLNGTGPAPGFEPWATLLKPVRWPELIATPDQNLISLGGQTAGHEHGEGEISDHTCTAPTGSLGSICVSNAECDSASGAGDGICSGEQLPDEFSFEAQYIDHVVGGARTLDKDPTRRGIHSTTFLNVDGLLYTGGDDRRNISRQGARDFVPGDPDLGVSNFITFAPPQLFQADGALAARPEIVNVSSVLWSYKKTIRVKVRGDRVITSRVAITRNDHATHSVNTGARLVILSCDADDGAPRGKGVTELICQTPTWAAQAIPGDYSLWALGLNDKGEELWSEAKHIRLNPCGEVTCRALR